MFRYIALAWPDDQAQPSLLAQQLSAAWQQRSEWQTSLRQPGLHVYSTGARRGINEATLLKGGHCTPDANDGPGTSRLAGSAGVILGQLFRRVAFDSAPSPPATLSGAESASILCSGGRHLVEQFWGRYVAFMQAPSGATQVLRDPSGTLPCFKCCHHGVWIIFSWLEDLLQFVGTAHATPHFAVEWDLLTTRLLNGPPNGRETALKPISQVLPGERVDLATGDATLLWSAPDHARRAADMDANEASRLLGHAVRSCVRSWAGCYDTVLLRLSGGVDSSILVSCLATGSTPADVICVNYHSPGANTDERGYAMLAAGRAGRDLITRERDPALRLEPLLQKLARLPHPMPYAGALNVGTDAKLAAAYHASAMFTGAGGDQLFYEHHHWWPAADYLHDKGLDLGFLAAAMDAARIDRRSLWHTIRLALRERITPELAARRPRYGNDLLSSRLTQAPHDPLRYAHPALREATDLPLAKYAQTAALMHPIGYYDPFEQAAAPEGVRPLFSQPLVELCLRMPTYLLTRGGHGRALARRTFAQDLPTQIATRRSKGATDDYLKTVLEGNLDFVRGMLLEGELSRRGLIDRAHLEEVLSGRPTSLSWAPGRVHELVAVEAWLSRWAP
jgi:asparagine synthase (glutamine-hydrolysing)